MPEVLGGGASPWGPCSFDRPVGQPAFGQLPKHSSTGQSVTCNTPPAGCSPTHLDYAEATRRCRHDRSERQADPAAERRTRGVSGAGPLAGRAAGEDYAVTPGWINYHLLEHEAEHRAEILRLVRKWVGRPITR